MGADAFATTGAWVAHPHLLSGPQLRRPLPARGDRRGRPDRASRGRRSARRTTLALPAPRRLRAGPRLPPAAVPPRPADASARSGSARAARAASSASAGTRRSTWRPPRSGACARRYGNGALFVPYGTGAYSNTNGSHLARRLFYAYGGCLDIDNSYSWACTNVATPTVYGTRVTGNQRQDWVNTTLHPDVGLEPGGDDRRHQLRLVREAGARARARASSASTRARP